MRVVTDCLLVSALQQVRRVWIPVDRTMLRIEVPSQRRLSTISCFSRFRRFTAFPLAFNGKADNLKVRCSYTAYPVWLWLTPSGCYKHPAGVKFRARGGTRTRISKLATLSGLPVCPLPLSEKLKSKKLEFFLLAGNGPNGLLTRPSKTDILIEEGP